MYEYRVQAEAGTSALPSVSSSDLSLCSTPLRGLQQTLHCSGGRWELDRALSWGKKLGPAILQCDPWLSTESVSPVVTWRESGTSVQLPLLSLQGDGFLASKGENPQPVLGYRPFWSTHSELCPKGLLGPPASQRWGLSLPWAAHFLPASQLCQGDSSCFSETASLHIPTPMASPAPSRCSINAPSFTRPSLLPGSPPASTALRSHVSQPSSSTLRPLQLPCPELLSRGHCSDEVPWGILAGQGLPSSQAAAAPSPAETSDGLP